MSKIIAATDLAQIVTKLLTQTAATGQLEEFKDYQRFMTEIAQVVCKHCGGDIRTPAGEWDNTWFISINGDDTLLELDGGIWRGYDPEGDLFPPSDQQRERNIFEEAFTAKLMSINDVEFVGKRQEIQINNTLAAQAILSGYAADTVIEPELYDRDSLFASCLTAMYAAFEFPDWDGRTLGNFLKKFSFSEAQIANGLNVLQYRTRTINTDGVHAANIAFSEFQGATPQGDKWRLPNGYELWLG